jgi:HEAT repeat protein
LPFNPKAELAAETPKPGKRLSPLRILAGVALFLVVLIGVVELARVLRPRLIGHFRLNQAALQQAVERLQDANESVRRQAAADIAAMGPDAVVAALDRITIEDRAGDKFFMVPGAVRAFAATGEDCVEGLRRALASPQLNIRFAAASVLRDIGAPGRAALPDLIAALQDPNRFVRGFAIDALGSFGSEAGPAVEPLAGLLDHPDVFMRRRAVDALACIGPAAVSTLPTLAKTQEQDPDAAVRRAAAVAARQVNVARIAEESLAGASDELGQTVKAFLADDKPAALAAAKLLGSMGGPAQPAIPSLVLATRDKEKWRREAAVRALGELGLLVRDFLPTLQAAAKEADPDVRVAAEVALVLIEGK